MALACDWLLVSPKAKMRPAFLNLAKVPEAGFQFLLARQIGEMKARDIVYRSAFVSGTEAAELGLASALVPGDDLAAVAITKAREAAGLAPITFAMTKRLFNARSGDFDAFLEQEKQAIVIAANTLDAKEGMAAFLEKRAPAYTGT